jgi:hypothetical protein
VAWARPAAAQLQQCTSDQQGPDDEPGQKDLTKSCAGPVCGVGATQYSWNFDDTNWTGNNTGDACVLFDTDGDGNANRAVCVTIVGGVVTPSMQTGNPKCYTCSDDRPTRCSGAQPVACTSTCTVTPNSADDPFPNPPNANHTQCHGTNCLSQDTKTTCCVQPSDDGGQLIDVCSYPSQSPNSDPSDCVETPTQCRNDSDCDDGNACTVDSCVNLGMGQKICRQTPGNAGTVCRASNGDACDAAETCNGTSASCPADVPAPAGTVCRAGSGVCDVQEVCTGLSNVCPADVKAPGGTPCTDDGNVCTADQCGGTPLSGNGVCEHPAGNAGTICRADSGQCDVAETCTGTSPACPADSFEPATAACVGGSQGGVCDAPDHCSGTSTACVDAYQPSTVECRPGTGQCDVAETCTGSSGACPADAFAPPGTACGDSSDTACDNPDSCNGSGACQANNEPTTTICRPDTGECDVAETCAPGGVCPADAFELPGTACGDPSNTVCDNPDTCDATGSCQANNEPATTVCRPGDGVCDVAETCAAGGVCPADAFAPATTPCTGTSQGGACDAADHCSGTSTACVDEFQPSTVECRADTGQCDVAESCTGTSGACPADTFEPSTAACTGTSQGGACDGTDHCSGTSTACVDEFQPSTVECRADTGQCDVAESCTGTSGACPADTFEPATAACTGTSQGGACDGTDHCSGTSTACVDVFQPGTFECRADGGQCDVAERCTGTGGACPPDAFEPSTTGCTGTSQGGACDSDDHCSGIGNTCVDVFSAATVVCRPDAGECDVEERCTGTSGACPGDVLEPAGTACGSGNDTECDNPNTCDSQGNCQANNEPAGTPCNEGDVCTSPDACDPHGQCEPGPVVGGCKVTGGGQLLASGSFPWISFGFNAQTGGGGVKGQLELNRHSAPKASYHSLQMQTLAITPIAQCTANPGVSGQKATFTGTIQRKGQAEPCEFEVVVEDCGEPGRYDYFSIDIQGPALCPESRSGVLDRGNIQVH